MFYKLDHSQSIMKIFPYIFTHKIEKTDAYNFYRIYPIFLKVDISDKLGMGIINIGIIYSVDAPFINYS